LQTYTNPQYGFSIKYPTDWSVSLQPPLSWVDSLQIKKVFGSGSEGYTCSSDISLVGTNGFDQYAYTYNTARISGWKVTNPVINGNSVVAWTNSENFPGTFIYFIKNPNSQYSYEIDNSTKTLGVYNQKTGIWTTMTQNVYAKDCADIFSQMISTFKLISK
jgi:hypothetical protein